MKPTSPQPTPPWVDARREHVERLVGGLRLLPTSAAVPVALLDVKRRDAGAAELSAAIAADPGLAARVIAVANAPAFGGGTAVSRVSEAVDRIGAHHALPLALGLSFAGLFHPLAMGAADRASLWRAALLRAVVAGEVAATLADPASAEALAGQAWAAALLQDVALPVLHGVDRSAWPELMAVLDRGDDERAHRERRMFGIAHADVGALCLAQLGLPAVVVDAVRFHHDGVDALAEVVPPTVAVALHVAAGLPHRFGDKARPVTGPIVSRLAARGVDATVAEGIAKRAAEGFAARLARLPSVEESGAGFKQFLQSLAAEVAGCVEASIGVSTVQINTLRNRERQLQEEIAALQAKVQQADVDPTTHALTRAAMLPRLGKLLDLARRHGAAYAAGVVALDDLKKIGDAHGHAAADAAAAAVAEQLAAAVGGRGIHGRLRGDEFAVALVARDAATLTAELNALTRRLLRVTATHGNVTLSLTASLGVVSVGVPDEALTAENVLHEADQLLRRARHAGKGRAEIGRAA